MRNLILAGAAALAFAVPAAAQDVAVDAAGNVYVRTDAQTVIYDGWPAEQRVMYDAWPMGVQEYYWTLDPMQVEGWWVLDDTQRVRIFEMTPEQRAAAWTSIAAQMNAGPAPMASTTATVATTAAASASTMAPRFVRSEVVQPTTDTPVAEGAEVPICKPDQQDNCINSWEARKTGTRPLNYWPGKPASEIDTPLPAEDPND